MNPYKDSGWTLKIPYNMKFSRHLNVEILWCAYFGTLIFRDFAKRVYFESLKLRNIENTRFISLAMLLNMYVLEFSRPTICQQ